MQEFKEWWESITQREQQLAMVSAVVIAIGILYWGIWNPLAEQLNDSKKQLTRAEATLDWTQQQATILLASGVTSSSTKKGNLTQIINASARQNGITFSRVVNKKDEIEVWITNVQFERFLKWLTLLSNKHGVSVVNADLAKTDQQGYIKVNRLLLSN